MDDLYLTIATNSRAEVKIKGSRFIGESFRVESVERAMDLLASIRKREYQANHHCYAFRVGHDGAEQFKYSDDGEPNGTAGQPIYDVIAGRDLTDLMLVVTRYFGGTKLGTGGLVRAYSETSRAVLEESGVRENLITRRFRVELSFPMYDKWLKEMRRLEATVVESEFSEQVKLTVEIRRSRAEQLRAALVELTSGRGQIEEVE